MTPSPPTRQARPRTAFWSFWTARRSTPRCGGQVADHGYLISGRRQAESHARLKRPRRATIVHTCELLDGTIHGGRRGHRPLSMKSAAPPSAAITPPPTCCRRPCARFWASMSTRPAATRTTRITHFDFTHFSAVSPAELAEVERRSSTRRSYEALPVTVKNLPIEEAKKLGAMALFGEKYGSVSSALSTLAAGAPSSAAAPM